MLTPKITVDERKSRYAPEFPFPAPEQKYGMPYSEIYLAHLEVRNRPKGRDEDPARRVVDGMGPVEAKAFGPVVAGAQYEVPPGVKRNQAYLKTLWDFMFPGRKLELNCKTPFSICFPCHDDEVLFSQCVARNPEEMADVLKKAAYMLGGKEVVLIAELSAEKRAFLCLDFADSVDLESVEKDADFSIKSRFQRAWFDLLSVHLEWVRGCNVLITKCLQEMHQTRAVCNFGHMVAQVAAAQQARRVRVQDREKQARELQPGSPEYAGKLLRQQVRAVREAAENEASAIGVADKEILDYAALREKLALFVGDERFCCLEKYQLQKLIHWPARRLVTERLEQLLEEAHLLGSGESSWGRFVQLFRVFMKEPEWLPIMAPLERLEICRETMSQHEYMRPSVDSWTSRIREDLMADMAREGNDMSELMQNLQL